MIYTNEPQSTDYETTTLIYVTGETTFDEVYANTTFATNSTWLDFDTVCNPQASSEDFLMSSLFQTIVYLMYCTVFLVALLGNGLVCFVVQSSPRMKTVTNYFIVNLAVGDILMTLFCVPFTFVSMLVLRYWPFGAVMCKLVNFSQVVSVMVSAYTLLAISIDRYMAIMRPLKPRLGKTAAKMVVAGVWGGAFVTAAPSYVVSKLQRPTDWHRFCKAWENITNINIFFDF